MAKWGWGLGCTELGPVDHADVWHTRLFDGSEWVREYVDFVDEEKGVYRVLVTDPPGQTAPQDRRAGSPAPVFEMDEDAGRVVREMRHAKAGLKVFRTSEEAAQS